MSNIYPAGDAQYSTNLGLSLWGADEVVVENFLLIDAAIGSGSSVKINGTVIPSVNFVNSATVTFSVVGSNVSATAVAPSGVTSVFSRTGAVVANANDYAAVASLVLGDGLGDDLAFGPAVNHIILGTNNAGYLQFLPTSFSLNDGNNTTISSTSGVVTLDSSGGTGQFQGNWNFANNTTFSSTVTDGSSSVGTSGQVLSSTVTGVKWIAAGAGTVTSVALTVPGVLFSVSGSPITTAGTLALSLLTQTANTVFAGPVSGGAATPTFRALVTADLPAGTGTVLSVTGTANQIVATGTANVVLSIANPFVFPGPASMGSNYISETRVVSAGGTTTAGLLVKTQPTGNVQTAALGDVSTTGIAITSQTAGQNVEVARIGLVIAVADNTITIGDIMVVGTVTAGRVSDSGQTSSLGVSNQLQIVGKALTAAVAGGTFTMQVYGPGFYGDQDSFPLTVANGVSGGIPYFSSTTTEASSALLAATGVVIGGGAGTAPATTTHLTFASDTLTVGLAGTSSGILALAGSTSGTATITAPAVAGTTTNAVTSSNNWSAPVLIATAAGAASLPSVSVTGAPFTGGTGTTTVPLVYINDGSAPTTWSTSGTEFGINAPSGFAGNLMDLHINGGASLFSINSVGGVLTNSSFTALSNVITGTTTSFIWSGRARMFSPADGVIELTNNAITAFTSLEFGGTTSGFVSLNSSTTVLTVGAGGVNTNPASLVVNGAITSGLTGTSSGVINLQGSTSGTATITAPAVAGTVTNPIAISNSVNLSGTGAVYEAQGNLGITATAIVAATVTTVGGIVTALSATSDERLKDSIPYEGGLEEILGIVPIRYRWNDKGQKHTGFSRTRDYVGFSANNVQRAIPEAIQGLEGPEQYLSFDDRPVIAALCNAVKELTARVKQLEGK